MKKKSLAQSNPYLRDPATRKRLLYQSVASSSAVEGIRAPFDAGSDAQRPKTTEERIAHVKHRVAKRGR